MTSKDIIASVANFYQIAHNGNYAYGDSHSLPPCADGITSCDRGAVARPLWDLGFKNQPAGGVTVAADRWMEPYLLKWGFKKITDQNKLKAGDIVIFRNANMTPNAGWHAFILTAFVSTSNVCKYDFGSQDRIRAGQPFTNVPLNEWAGIRWFYCAFRWEDKVDGFTFTPKEVKKNTKSNSAYLATEIMMSKGYQGVKKDGKIQNLQLDFTWSKGDMAAMAHYKWDKVVNGKNLCSGPYGAGEIGPSDWADLLGGSLPFTAVELPTKQRSGTSVLLCQEILRGRGIKGKDGKPLALTSKWDANLEYAVKSYQKIRKLSQTGKVTTAVWKDMLGNI